MTGEVKYGTGAGRRKHIIEESDGKQRSLCGAWLWGAAIGQAHAPRYFDSRASGLQLCKICERKHKSKLNDERVRRIIAGIDPPASERISKP